MKEQHCCTPKRRNSFGLTVVMLFLMTTSVCDADEDDIIILPNEPCCVLKGGFYLGVAGGFDVYRAKASPINTISDFIVLEEPALSLTGGVGGAFFGYGRYFPRFHNTYLGLEMFANGSAAESDEEILIQAGTSSGSFVTHVKAKNNFGISLLSGIKFSPGTLLYIRLGANGSKINMDEFVNSGSQQEVTPMVYGFSYGLGIESIFFNDFSLRVEYTYTSYSDFETDIGTDVEPSNNEFMLGLNYHFDLF